MRLLLIWLMLLPFCIQHAKAETTVPGSNCNPITSPQAQLMEWREQGLQNSSSNDYWIICPLERAAGVAELELTLRAVNKAADTLGISCSFREFHKGKQQQGKSITSEIEGKGSSDLRVLMTPKERDSVMNVTCKLTKGIAIEATSIGFSDYCTYANFAGGWSVAMAYDYDGYELGIAFLSLNGDITGQTNDGQNVENIEGRYEVSEVDCSFFAEYSVGGVTVRMAGFLSEDQHSLNFAAANSFGFYTHGVLTRLAGIGGRGNGSVGRITIPSP